MAYDGPTILLKYLVCKNCKQWKPNKCDLINIDGKTETSLSCINIWKDDNYIGPKRRNNELKSRTE